MVWGFLLLTLPVPPGKLLVWVGEVELLTKMTLATEVRVGM